MSETPHSQDEPQSESAKRRIRWDAAAAIIASLVGLLALIVAGYTAHIQRQQVRAQVWPYLIGGISGHKNELVWINKGVGPAIVRDVEITIDGKPQGDWAPLMRTLGLRSVAYHQSRSPTPDNFTVDACESICVRTGVGRNRFNEEQT